MLGIFSMSSKLTVGHRETVKFCDGLSGKMLFSLGWQPWQSGLFTLRAVLTWFSALQGSIEDLQDQLLFAATGLLGCCSQPLHGFCGEFQVELFGKLGWIHLPTLLIRHRLFGFDGVTPRPHR